MFSSFAGPSRRIMDEYRQQAAESQANSSDLKQALPPSSAPSPMGMMQLPGRSRRGGKYPLDLVSGGVAYEATVLGELAVIPIEDVSFE